MERLYLSRRNLLTLLSKLDRNRQGDSSFCTIVKCDNVHPRYPQSACMVTALEDEEYYDREPGKMHPKDVPQVEDKFGKLLQKLADPKNWIGNPEVFRDPDGKCNSVQELARSVLNG